MAIKAPLIITDKEFDLANFLQSGTMMSMSQNKLLLGWGEPNRSSLNQIDPNQPAFYFTDFFLTAPQPWIQYPHSMEISNEELLHLLHPRGSLSPCEWVMDRPEYFKSAFDELFQLFQGGRLQKGVPYLFARSQELMHEERLKNSLHRALTILNQKKAGYLYGHWHLSFGVLGITPELLFSHSEQEPSKVHTMALAGTCPLNEADEAFLKNEKEQHEHQLVVQGISASLQEMGKVKRGETALLKLTKLAHLMTPIEVDLFHSFDFGSLVERLHPTPALGAFPLEEGRQWLQKLQRKVPRNFYGAPLGFKQSQTGLSKCYVGIRNVQWDGECMRIGAGCGVVPQSHFDNEWKEVQLKIHSIKDQLAL